MGHFTDENLGTITSTLGVERLISDTIELLENNVTEYLDAKFVEEEGLLSSNKEKQEQLSKLAATTGDLEKALMTLDMETRACIDKDFTRKIDIDSLSLLREAAVRCKDKFSSRGLSARRARHMLVRGLKTIYEEVSHNRATRTHDPVSGLDKGKFLEFVCAVLLMVDPDARKGIEHVIRDVLSS